MDPVFAEEFTEKAQQVNDAGASLLYLNIILNLVLRQSLKTMWGMVNILQFVVYYHLIKVNLAPHANEFLVQLKVIALGEFIPYDLIKEKTKELLGIEEDQSFMESSLLVP